MSREETVKEQEKKEESVCIDIPVDVYEELRRLSEELGIPIGAVLRRLLEKA
ncbi:hypothetical protein PYJP_00020 [Pyrofollis japonicus]|uniref:hypothetical protein n=1 Tax=Pyrofollis japonicus TaxID=3060460 RepID=UPI00295B0ECE|nr:hypothetical protein [Pyrofollis japonicus]BEP16650.1 hypothetical protein PYJP_00020 [Pyrofollis japonicus]